MQAGVLENVVELLGGAVQLRATATCVASSDSRTDVYDAVAAFSVGGRQLGATRSRSESERGYVDWLYLDEDMRVTRGSKGSLFIHVREEADGK